MCGPALIFSQTKPFRGVQAQHHGLPEGLPARRDDHRGRCWGWPPPEFCPIEVEGCWGERTHEVLKVARCCGVAAAQESSICPEFALRV